MSVDDIVFIILGGLLDAAVLARLRYARLAKRLDQVEIALAGPRVEVTSDEQAR